MNTIASTGRAIFPSDSKAPAYKATLPETEGFNRWDISSIVDYIVKHYHVNARTNIIVIYELAQKVFARHCDKHPELAKLVESLFLFFDDLLFHMKKEEQILFPNIIQLNEKKLHEGAFEYSTFGIIKEYVLKMRKEHQETVSQFDFFRRLTNDYRLPDDASMLYVRLYSKMKQFENEKLQHMQLENHFLFPKAIRLDEKTDGKTNLTSDCLS